MGEASKVYNYDSSYFSKKMVEVDKRAQYDSVLGYKGSQLKTNPMGLHISKTPIQNNGDIDAAL
jgi:hypothetical protein